MSRQVVSVRLLTSYVRELLESDDLLSDLWVEGEIAEAFVARSGHVYFTLHDEESRLKCVLFRAQAQRLRVPPRPGDHVAAHGRISVYERDGTYQLYVDFLQPAGMGILALQLELLRQQLASEGLFEPARKRPIPRMPNCIGVVTSAEGAVWHDIQHVLRRRYPLAHVLLAATSVQGDGAPRGIVAALQALQDDGRPEVIIVARGGGSAEDLWCFNDERVVRAVFACRVPVVSGVGHETDWTLIDEVADLRAPTPSAAAELCSPSIVDLAARLVDVQREADRLIQDTLEDATLELRQLRSKLERLSPVQAARRDRAHLAELRDSLDLLPNVTVATSRAAVAERRLRLSTALQDRLSARKHRLELEQARLVVLDPGSVLRRGYAHLTAGQDGRPVTSVDDVSVHDRISARLADGVIAGRVERLARQSLVGTGAAIGND
ncbi:MAG: exodeoxyribonuclease large subunit [Thermomicrobiales bacterium]|nr:exodeoxyribonuclease large subunit [Thermomicrobiales bacterium]